MSALRELGDLCLHGWAQLSYQGSGTETAGALSMAKLSRIAVLIAAASAVVCVGAGAASADAGAEGFAYGSPGVLSGNVVQIPISVPINVCGNSLNLLGALNPSFGNTCINGGHRGHKGGYDNGKGGHEDKYGRGHSDDKRTDHGYGDHNRGM